MNKLKLIKLIVVFLSLLLISGFVTAAGIIYKKVSKNSLPTQTEIVQPFGSQIFKAKLVDGSILLHRRGGSQPDRILLIDPQNGNIKSSINLKWETN